MKKTERRFTKINHIKHLISLMYDKGSKTVFDYFDRDGDIQTISYTALADKIKAFGTGLRRFGLAKKRVAIIGESSPKWYIAYLATIAYGGIAIPLDKELALSEIENFLKRSGAHVIVFSPLFETKFADMVKRHPEITFIPMESEPEKNMYSNNMDTLIGIGAERPYEPPAPADLNRMTVMLFTSGTTGTSKCVMLSERNICTSINSACETVDFYPEDVLVSVLPIHHTYELCCSLAAVNYGCEIAINDSLRHVMRNFAKFRPTALVLVPLFLNTMDKKIWDEIRKKNKETFVRKMMSISDRALTLGLDARRILFKEIIAAFGGRLRKIICGGAPLNQDIAQDFRSLGIHVWEGYGITECSPLISVDVYYHSKPGSVGPAVPGCKVYIDGSEINEYGYTVGEICVKGKNVMLGYYEDPEATDAVFTSDGYFRTGDVGYLDDDGYIYITGRKKSVIVLENGKNVFPEEIEEYLESIEQIAESVVVGRPCKESDSITLTAIIYPDLSRFPQDATAEDISAKLKNEINRMNKRLVGYKQIRAIEVRDTEFEKTTTKKIKRHLVH